jgi:SpoVK/Ycf46/Vps4 family AAA+-type ATPase
MNLKLKSFSEGNTYGFPPNSMTVWITEAERIQLFGNIPVEKPEFVRIECKQPLSRFVMFARLGTINPKREDLGDGVIWIPHVLFNKSWIVEKNTMVEVTSIDTNSICKSDSLTIKFNPEDVKNWSDEESSYAETHIRKNVGVIYISQHILINPKTKKVVVGEIDYIYPKPAEFNAPFLIDSNTKINLVGLPLDSQKVIDFSQIGGLSNLINRLREIIQIPINYPEYLERFGIKPPKGMLMFGPPGNGKTMIARAVAHSMGSSFIIIEAQELMSKYVGVGEQRLREKFDEAESKGNCVIFIDEIDSIASNRSATNAEYQISIVATLLSLMDGMRSSNKVFVIGATNRINVIDPALRRPGRFDLEFEVPLPDTNARKDILSKYIKLENLDLFDMSVSKNILFMLSELTNGYSGADISLLYREAVMNSVRNNLKFNEDTGRIEKKTEADNVRLKNEDFLMAMKAITPTSLRGIDILKSSVEWDDIIALDSQKSELESIHHKIETLITHNSLKQRLSFLNVLIEGIKGSGKRTLVHAFARKFNYEIIELDFISMSSYSIEENFQTIDNLFVKAKQIAPSILVFKNLEKTDLITSFANKIQNELSKINKHQRTISILTCESTELLPKFLIGYKGFEYKICLNQRVEQFLPFITQLIPGFDDSNICTNASIGEVLSSIYEYQIEME